MSSSHSSKTTYRKSLTTSYPTTVKTVRKSRMSSMGTAGYGTPLNFKGGVISSISSKGATDIKFNREKEKREMQDLNERFANYIEKVRFLETENNALKEALKKNKRDFNVEPLKAKFQAEIDELKKQLQSTTDENATLKARIATLEDELENLNGQVRHLREINDQQQNTIENLNEEIARRMSESEMLRRKVQELEKLLADWKTRHSHLDSQLQAIRIELQDETANRLCEATRAQALEDDLNFFKDIYETEIKEYKALLSKDNTFPDMREYWTSEMGSCIKEISQEYESQLEAMAAGLEARYESQISEIRMGTSKGVAELSQVSDENKRLRSLKNELEERVRDLEGQLAQMNSQVRSLTIELENTQHELESEKDAHRSDVDRLQLELEALMKELQDLMDAKLSMELEIAAYRKLLEGEEHRISFGGMVSSVGGYQSASEEILSSALTQRSSGYKSTISEGTLSSMGSHRVTVQRSSSGPISIVEIETNGQYIALEETGNRKMGRAPNLKGWTIERYLEHGKTLSHTFKDDLTFPNKGAVIRVYGSKSPSTLSKNDYVAHNISEWGNASVVSRTVLKDENGVEKAMLSTKNID